MECTSLPWCNFSMQSTSLNFLWLEIRSSEQNTRLSGCGRVVPAQTVCSCLKEWHLRKNGVATNGAEWCFLFFPLRRHKAHIAIQKFLLLWGEQKPAVLFMNTVLDKPLNERFINSLCRQCHLASTARHSPDPLFWIVAASDTWRKENLRRGPCSQRRIGRSVEEVACFFSHSLGVTISGCPSKDTEGWPTEALRHRAAQTVASGRKQTTVEWAMAKKVACVRKTRAKKGDLQKWLFQIQKKWRQGISKAFLCSMVWLEGRWCHLVSSLCTIENLNLMIRIVPPV